MNARQRATLEAVFAVPTRSDLSWADIESLFLAVGGRIAEGRGSRVRVSLGERRAVFHRPHPERIAGKGMVESVRRFLVSAGVGPETTGR